MREFYPWYMEDVMVEVTEEVAEKLLAGQRYIIKAMENCGFHAKDIHQVLVELYEVFDFCAVEEAAHYYENWQY